MDVLIGTSNPGKLQEIREIIGDLPFRLLSLRDRGLEHLQVEESGLTLQANASLKAVAYANASGLPTLADDTGLFVDALGGAPGIYPARYGGADLTMPERRAKLLGELYGLPDAQRTARFMCVVALARPNNDYVQMAQGVCEGYIAQAEQFGESGFGYDPLFIPAGYHSSFSQMGEQEKNQISHRGQALRAAIPLLESLMLEAD